MFSDYICPFCYLGKAIVNRLSARFDVEIEHIGFEIHPETDSNGIDLRQLIPETNEMYDYLKVRGKEYGLNFCDLRVLSNSRKALLVGEYARELGKNDEFTDKIFKSYFEDCQNIGLEEVIVNAAQKVGLSRQRVIEALQDPFYKQMLSNSSLEGRKYDVCSVPTFIVNDKYKIIGAQPEKVFIDIFERAKNESS
jgi:predicted DsbA family dithiol-disulfide isomerase